MSMNRFKQDYKVDGWPVFDTTTQKLLSTDEIIENLNRMNSASQRVTQLECSLYLALNALDFDAGDWNEVSVLRHLREQIDLGRNYLRNAFDQEAMERLSEQFQRMAENGDTR